MTDHRSAALIKITGIVQGVGFRPFIYSLAEKFHLTGWVRNTSAGVDIHIEGIQTDLLAFIDSVWEEAPPLAHIDDVVVTHLLPTGYENFEIIHSAGRTGDFMPISPDVSICADCLSELFDRHDHRYRYPFINCTNCGPRFTIIRDIPYDRPATTMAGFPMCPRCQAEYDDPRNRRFHAQPIACPDCGPQVWLEVEGQPHVYRDEAILATRALLKAGKIIAIKGLGGFHLACDASNAAAVSELRRRKLRVDKAFAVMFANLQAIEENCYVGSVSHHLLESPERPIVILDRRNVSQISKHVAPGQATLGAMLPYTPLHYLLLEPEVGFPTALVMTSGNLSEEPIATSNQEARERLVSLADAFLFHDREIETRCDDSVIRFFQNSHYPIRRARGYAPFPVYLPWKVPQILATGPELKNTFCLTKDQYAFVSHHIGDLENFETYTAFEAGIHHFERLFRIKPEIIAYDTHPNYLATRYAQERAEAEKLPAIPVQHHHAHIASCMVENKISQNEKVIGVAFDGTGYGDDHAIWGGEFLLSTYDRFERYAHLNYVRLPGGDRAVREPWRTALSWLRYAGVEWDPALPPVAWAQDHPDDTPFVVDRLESVSRQIFSGINAPYTSSLGRLFDAVASLVGIRHTVNYEAQAAIELESHIAENEFGIYEFDQRDEILDFGPVIRNIAREILIGIPPEVISARFHNTLAILVHEVCRKIRFDTGINQVFLSGGVWQNRILLGRAYKMLVNDSFLVYHHHQVPANDGGVSLGQAAVAIQRCWSG